MYEHLTKLREARVQALRMQLLREYFFGFLICTALVAGVSASLYYQQQAIRHIVHAHVEAVPVPYVPQEILLSKQAVLHKPKPVDNQQVEPRHTSLNKTAPNMHTTVTGKLPNVVNANVVHKNASNDTNANALTVKPLPLDRYIVYGKAREFGIKYLSQQGVERLNGQILKPGDTFPNGEQIFSFNVQTGRIETQIRTIQMIE